MNIQILRLFFYILVWQCLYSLSFDIFWEYFIIMLLKNSLFRSDGILTAF